MFFTKNGYKRHLFQNHKIRNVADYEPDIIEKTIRIFGQDGYETSYRKVAKKQDSKKVKLVEYSWEDDNDTSALQNENIDEENIDTTNAESEGVKMQEANKITAGPWTLTIPQVRKEKDEKERTVHCTLCSESFFYKSGLNTHMQHAHKNEKNNEDSIYANKLE